MSDFTGIATPPLAGSAFAAELADDVLLLIIRVALDHPAFVGDRLVLRRPGLKR